MDETRFGAARSDDYPRDLIPQFGASTQPGDERDHERMIPPVQQFCGADGGSHASKTK